MNQGSGANKVNNYYCYEIPRIWKLFTLKEEGKAKMPQNTDN